MNNAFYAYLDAISDALSDAGIASVEAGDYLASLAVGYAESLVACPRCPETVETAGDALSDAVEGVSTGPAIPARFRRAAKSLARRLPPSELEAIAA